MGRNPDPDRAELLYLFRAFRDGKSIKEIIETYERNSGEGVFRELEGRGPRFLRQKREEFEVAKEVLEENEENISHSQAEILSQSKENRADSELLIDAKKAHLEEVKNLIARWMNLLVAPEPLKVYFDTDTCEANQIQSEPLFPHLREHISNPKVWQDWTDWQKSTSAYFVECKRAREIAAKLVNPIAPNYLMWGWSGFVEPGPHNYSRLAFHNAENEYLHSIEDTVLPLLNDIRAMEKRLHDRLGDVLLKRSYIFKTCMICPESISQKANV
jgi:hypothetical protein